MKQEGQDRKRGRIMTRQEQLRKSVNNLNANDGSDYHDWILLFLTSIADSLAMIADSLSDDGEEVVERKKGEWINVTNGRGGMECSNCHAYSASYKNGDDYLSNFCPNCGADMRGRKNG